MICAIRSTPRIQHNTWTAKIWLSGPANFYWHTRLCVHLATYGSYVHCTIVHCTALIIINSNWWILLVIASKVYIILDLYLIHSLYIFFVCCIGEMNCTDDDFEINTHMSRHLYENLCCKCSCGVTVYAAECTRISCVICCVTSLEIVGEAFAPLAAGLVCTINQ